MSKSKRKRNTILVRTIPEEELGPNFYPNLRDGFLNQYQTEISSYLNSITFIHNLLQEKSKIDKNDYSWLHRDSDRNTLIQCMVILDSYIGQALHNFQLRILKTPESDIKNYSKIDEGISECLKGMEIPIELDRNRTLIKNFRTLRNQFSHYKYGVFSFSAKHESFETFLKKLEGIETKPSYHCFIDGKAGVLLPYEISSDKFIEKFYSDSIEFYKLLLNFLFPNIK